jgi:hypothetical protein
VPDRDRRGATVARAPNDVHSAERGARPALALAAVMFSLAALDASPAAACSRICFSPGVVLPLDGGAVPANAVWPFFSSGDGPEQASLVRVDSGAPVGVVIDADAIYFVRVTEPIAPGAYRLDLLTNCLESPRRSQVFDVLPEAPLPSTLGRLRAEPPDDLRVGLDAGGLCQAHVDGVGSRVSIELDPEAMPWADVLVFSTVVDGAEYRPRHIAGDGANAENGAHAGGSWEGRGRDLLFAACSGSNHPTVGDLEEGIHRVKMTATLAGTPLFLETEEVEIELRCADHDGCAAGGTNGPALAILLGLAVLRRRSRAPLLFERARYPRAWLARFSSSLF